LVTAAKHQVGICHAGLCALSKGSTARKADDDSSRIAAMVTNFDLLFSIDFFLHIFFLHIS
jgi:hypothetical protein